MVGAVALGVIGIALRVVRGGASPPSPGESSALAADAGPSAVASSRDRVARPPVAEALPAPPTPRPRGFAPDTPPLPPLSPPVAKKIASALARAPSCVVTLPVQSDALWALDLARALVKSPELDADVERRKRALDASSPLGVLLDPATPPYAVPNDVEKRELGPDGKLMLTMLDSLACRGGGEPSPRLRAFVDETYDGYAQSHQFFAIEWATRAGCRVPPDWPKRQEELVDRVLDELRSTKSFSDLFVEEVFLVELAGRSGEIEPAWIDRVVAAQGSNGCWTDSSKTDIRLAGGSFESTQAADHTSGLALYALARYAADRR